MSFTDYHPIVLFLFFFTVISCTMLILHPVYLVISLVAAFLLLFFYNKKSVKKFSFFYIVLFLTTFLINPIINPTGEHVILQIGTRPITLEATLYGMAIASLIISALLWFSSYHYILTSDKLLFLFAKVMPSFALVIVITMRLIPQFHQQIQKIHLAQKALGMDYQVGNLKHRMTSITKILSTLITWALENAVETADAMKARGYGTGKSTQFTIYTFKKKDKTLLCCLLFLIVLQVYASIKGYTQYSYYPSLDFLQFNGMAYFFYVSYALLCTLPIWIEIRELLKWH